jgi:hypothetical protein
MVSTESTGDLASERSVDLRNLISAPVIDEVVIDHSHKLYITNQIKK